MVWPGVKFTFDASGLVPHGYTVTKPPPTAGFSPSTTVTFNATAPIPAPGSPPLFSTFNLNGAPSPSAPPTLAPLRVSNTRDGRSEMNDGSAAADVRGWPLTLITAPAATSIAETMVIASQRELATDFKATDPDMNTVLAIDV